MTGYFQQRCSLRWTPLGFATVSWPVNTVTTPAAAAARACVAEQRRLCLPCTGIYNKSGIRSRVHRGQVEMSSLALL